MELLIGVGTTTDFTGNSYGLMQYDEAERSFFWMPNSPGQAIYQVDNNGCYVLDGDIDAPKISLGRDGSASFAQTRAASGTNWV